MHVVCSSVPGTETPLKCNTEPPAKQHYSAKPPTQLFEKKEIYFDTEFVRAFFLISGIFLYCNDLKEESCNCNTPHDCNRYSLHLLAPLCKNGFLFGLQQLGENNR